MCDSSDPLGLYDLLSTVLWRARAKENFDRLVPTLIVVGGGSVARVLRASYDSMLALRACFQESTRDTRPTTEYLVKINHTAAIAVDIAWEKLHTGAWSDACLAWRELYVVGTMCSSCPPPCSSKVRKTMNQLGYFHVKTSQNGYKLLLSLAFLCIVACLRLHFSKFATHQNLDQPPSLESVILRKQLEQTT